MRKLVLFAAPFALAAAVYVYFLAPTVGFLLAGISFVASVAFYLTKWSSRRAAAIAAAGIAAGFLWSAGYECLLLQPVWTLSGQTVEISAEVCDYPQETDWGCRVTVLAEADGKRGKTLLYLGSEYLDLVPGDRVAVTAALQQSSLGSDGEEFLYYQSKGIVLTASAKSEPNVIRCDNTPLRYAPVVFAQTVKQLLSRLMPEDTAAYMQALLTGDKSGLSYQTSSQMSVAGVSHTLAISGMHVSILLGALYFVTRKRARLLAITGIPLVLFFVVMTGCSPSVVRAAVMQILLLLAPLLNRDNDPPTTLCAALLVILLENPWAVSNVSFQLSFAAMAGILLFTGRLYHRMVRYPWVQACRKIRFLGGCVSAVITCISTTLGAIVFTTPIIALTFGAVSLYAVLSNLLIFGVVSLCFLGGIFTCLAGFVWLPLGKVLGWLMAWPVRYVLWVTGLVARLPFASLSSAIPYVAFWLVFAYLALGVILLHRGRKPVLLCCGCVSVGLAAAIVLTVLEAKPEEFQITALDVGQGQCICLTMPGFSAVIDCGGSNGDEAGELAARHLKLAGEDALDCLILTHYDLDHIGGVFQLLDSIPVQTVYLPDVEDSAGSRGEVEQAAREHGVQIVYVVQDIALPVEGGMLQIFAPVSYYDDNAASLSVLYTVGAYDMLVTGDMDKYAEYDLLLRHDLPDIELFVAGHHGSKSSSSMELLEATKPETVIICVGYNSYGHPTQEALERFAAIGAEVYRTDLCGDITVGR